MSHLGPVYPEPILLDHMHRALARAQQTPFYQRKWAQVGWEGPWDGSLEHWRRLPVTTKDELRGLSPAVFYREFCAIPPRAAADFWRSGGVTGKPLLYPRSRADLDTMTEMYRRSFLMAGVGPGDLVMNCLPLGLHPAGHNYATAMDRTGISQIWCGSGANTPSEQQVEVLYNLRPTVLMGMPSYGIHLGQLATEMGYHPLDIGIRCFMACSELLTPAKRDRIRELWGCEVYDTFGMSEAGHLGADCHRHNGYHVFSDLFFLEVLDPNTLGPVPAGAPGLLVVTPLFMNEATPFVRWLSGDIVTLTDHCNCGGPFARLVLRITGRTAGFWKIRGVNLNHAELEDLLLGTAGVADFRAFALRAEARDSLRLELEVAHDASEAAVLATVAQAIKAQFELQPELAVLPPGTIRRDLTASVKAVRFHDRRPA